MSVSQNWAVVPRYTHLQVLNDKSKGIRVRSRRRRPGSTRTTGGVDLETCNGKYRVRTNPQASYDLHSPEAIWSAAFEGKELS